MPGHLLPLCNLGRILRKRGHRVTVFTLADSLALVRQQGVEAVEIGQKTFPLGSMEREWGKLSRGHGLLTTLRTGLLHRRLAQMMCKEIPSHARALGIDKFLVDQLQFQGAAIAQAVGVPFYSFACAIHFPLSLDPQYPPPGAPWGYKSNSRWRRWLNKVMHLVLESWYGMILREGNHLAKSNGQPTFCSLRESYSPLLTLTQMPEFLDFPMRPLPREQRSMHYLGPMRLLDHAKNVVTERDPNLVYCSFGTLQTGLLDLYQNVIEAATLLPHRKFLLSRGAWRYNTQLKELEGLPPNVELVPFVDQISVLTYAACMITHGGANSVAECIYFGVPMVCIPITNDQPFIAQRIKDRQLGLVLPLRKAGAQRIAQAVEKVLSDPQIKQMNREAQRATQNAMEDANLFSILEL